MPAAEHRSKSNVDQTARSAECSRQGEMWSVVTESPTLTRTRAPDMPDRSSGSNSKPSKYGGD